jgi:hypothetical protein
MKRADRLSSRAVIVSALALFFSVIAGSQAPAMAASPGPSFVYPADGQTLGYDGAFLFKVNPVTGASGYLYGFFQGGSMVWENYRDERKLSGTEYEIQPGTPGHDAIRPGAVEVWVRALVNDQWTDATIINITVGTGSSGNSNPNVAKPTPPSAVTTSFCFGSSLNLIWQDNSASDSFRVYKDSERVELTRGDGKLRVSGPSRYVYEVPGPIQHATLGVSAVKGGVESDIARPRQPTFTCGQP